MRTMRRAAALCAVVALGGCASRPRQNPPAAPQPPASTPQPPAPVSMPAPPAPVSVPRRRPRLPR